MSRMLLGLIAGVALAFASSGCDRGGDAPSAEPVAAETDDEAAGEVAAEEEDELVVRARELAALATQMEAEPERIEEHLAEAGLSPDELDELLFEISEHPQASEAYAEAR